MIIKNICHNCGGIGHDNNCKCDDICGFIIGCCETCAGEGLITVKQNVPKKLWIPEEINYE